MVGFLRAHPAITAATAAYVSGFGVVGAIRRDGRALVYVAVMVLLYGLLAAAHRRTPFTTPVLAGLAVWGFLHMAGGLLPSPGAGPAVLYNTWLVRGVVKYDQLVHAYAYALVTAACWQVLARRIDPARATPLGLGLMASLMSVGLGTINEVAEFLASRSVRGLSAGGLENLGWDLVFNLAGSGMMALWLGLRLRGARRARSDRRAPAGSVAAPGKPAARRRYTGSRWSKPGRS